MTEKHMYFWFSWLPDATTNQGSVEKRSLSESLDKVVHLLYRNTLLLEDSETTPISFPISKAYTLPEAIEPLLNHLEKMKHKELRECLVCGILNPKAARLVSVEKLGIDLFLLPAKYPQNNSKPQFCFRYVCISSLVDVLEGLDHKSALCLIKAPDRDKIRLQLQAARCDVWLSQSRSRVAHGNRDRIQFKDSKDILRELKQAKKAIPSDKYRLCQDSCSAIAALDEDIERLTATPSEEYKHTAVRDLANLDCLTSKLAPLIQFHNEPKDTPTFNQIVIFEDHDAMRNHIVDSLVRFVVNKNQIIVADPFKSLKEQALVAIDGKSIGGLDDNCYELPRSSQKSLRTLFCFDLEVCDPKTGEFMDICGISAGMWFLYKCAKEFPLASRLIITGHRRLDELGLNSGAGDLLFKPFTSDELLTAVRSALRHRVLWVSPESVNEEWIASLRQFSKHIIDLKHTPLQFLDKWLSDHNLEFENVSCPSNADSSGRYDVVVLDLYRFQSGVKDYSPNRILECITAVRRWPKQPKLIVIVPHEQMAMSSDGLLQTLGEMLRDGIDKIIHKPIALICDENSDSVGREIIRSISDTPDFDVKYVAAAPLMGLVWAKSQSLFLNALEKEGCHENDFLRSWAPLGVLMGDSFGFSCSPMEVVKNADARMKLTKRFKEEIKNNKNRWRRHNVNPADVITNFCSDCEKTGSTLDGIMSVEFWLKHVIDTMPGEYGSRKGFEENLVKLFGGETRFSFGSSGGWYNDKGECVNDVSLIIEFCAKRGILARTAINKIIVEYLTQKGYEEKVSIQEIPIRGYILPRNS